MFTTLALWFALTFLSLPHGENFEVTPIYPPIMCSNPCVIEFSAGGIVDLFEAQGRQLAADKTEVIVDGPCFSACTLLVDLARKNVCVTHNALLGYHQGFMDTPTGPTFEQLKYETPGLEKYLLNRGGQPLPTSGHMLMLNFDEAKLFYKACKGA